MQGAPSPSERATKRPRQLLQSANKEVKVGLTLPSIASVVVDSSSRDDMDINHEEEEEEAIEAYILTRPD